MHRALFTYFLMLVFCVLLTLKLESHKHWNWFLIFLPLWLYDLILLIDALFNIIIHCKHESLRVIIKNKNNLLVLIVLLKIAAQVVICLKLEYKSLNLDIYHVLLPLWLLLPVLIIDLSVTLIKTSRNE